MKKFTKILVVDDDNQARKTISDFLQNEGYTVSEAVDGDEALSRIDNNKPDLVMLDTEMPGKSGYEICNIIKNEKKLDCKVIIYTGHFYAVDVVKALEAGADDFLGKTSNLVNLKNAIKDILVNKSV